MTRQIKTTRTEEEGEQRGPAASDPQELLLASWISRKRQASTAQGKKAETKRRGLLGIVRRPGKDGKGQEKRGECGPIKYVSSNVLRLKTQAYYVTSNVCSGGF